jgi:hypothetical protein
MKVFQLYDIDKNKNIWDSKDEHTSLAYAADSNGDFVVTASFYDQKIRIWSIR